MNTNVRPEEMVYFQKAIKTHLKQDKQKFMLNKLRSELDVREKWAGIRSLKNEFKPLPYNRKDKAGNIVSQNSRAETAAQHLAYEQWRLKDQVDNLDRENRYRD